MFIVTEYAALKLLTLTSKLRPCQPHMALCWTCGGTTRIFSVFYKICFNFNFPLTRSRYSRQLLSAFSFNGVFW